MTQYSKFNVKLRVFGVKFEEPVYILKLVCRVFDFAVDTFQGLV